MTGEPASEPAPFAVVPIRAERTPALVGRDAELQSLLGMLQPGGPAVINVTGPRGIGKSALIHAALGRAASWFVDVRRLDLAGDTASSALTRLRQSVALLPIPLRRSDARSERERMLLLIDHADVLAKSGRELAELTAGHSAVRVLVESLPQVRDGGVIGVHVGPLDKAGGETLFRRTAASAAVSLGSDPRSAEAISRICSAVDGNPLAIELAALRLPFVPLSDLAELLESPERALAVLTAPAAPSEGARDVRSNLAAVHRSTSTNAQQLLDLLSVFVGSFTLEAVEAVSAGSLPSHFDALSELLDQWLVELDEDAGHARYRLSNLVRGFAFERLTASGLRAEARARRGAYYADIARRSAAAFDDADDDRAREILGDEYREAVAASRDLADVDPDAALRLAADLGWAAEQRRDGAIVEILTRLTRTSPAGDAAARRDALLWLAQFASWSSLGGDRSTFIAGQLAEGMALARSIPEPLPLLRALRSQYIADVGIGAIPSAMDSCREGVRLASQIGHTRWLGRFEITLGAMCAVLRDYAEGARLAGSGLNRAIRAGDRPGIAIGSLALHSIPAEHVPNRAELPPLESVLEIFRLQGDLVDEAHTLATLAHEAIDREDPRQATAWVLTRQERLGRSDLLNGLTISVMLGVHIGRLRGDHAEAALLHGAVAAHAEPLMAIISPSHSALYRDGVDQLRASLGDAVFDAQVALGRTLSRDETLDELVGYLRGVADDGPTPKSPDPAPPRGQLTPREEQVLKLMADGLRNKEIADRLRITPKSVMHHTVSIYRKLGVRGRTEAVAAAVRSGRLPVP